MIPLGTTMPMIIIALFLHNDNTFNNGQYFRMWTWGLWHQPGALNLWWNSAVIGETNCTMPSWEYYDETTGTLIPRER